MKKLNKRHLLQAAGKVVPVDLEAVEVTDALLHQACIGHHEQYGYIPREWEQAVKKLMAKNRYIVKLLAHGHDREELIDLDITELQSMVEEYEIAITVTATPSGGISINRQPLKKAA